MIHIPEFSYTKKDFKLDWYSGSGAGGQNRNKVMACLRLTHLPSGITVTATEHRDRQPNLKLAFKRLKPHLTAWIKSEMKIIEARKRAEASEVIRTYNIAENRVTDHASGNQYPWSDVDMRQLIFDRKNSL